LDNPERCVPRDWATGSSFSGGAAVLSNFKRHPPGLTWFQADGRGTPPLCQSEQQQQQQNSILAAIFNSGPTPINQNKPNHAQKR
jgi:hypothetical protein